MLLFEINIFGIAVLDHGLVHNFEGKCIVISCIFFLSRFAHIYETIFWQTKDDPELSKVAPCAYVTFGTSLITTLNSFLAVVNFCCRI